MLWSFFGNQPHYGHSYYVGAVALLLHLVDRQIEYILRLEFQWTIKLEKEKEEALHLGNLNRLLLLNILPEHVAVRFLNDSSAFTPGKPYSETYEWVAVMFASIANYAENYTENSMNDQGLKCLQILNEIIHDFDKASLF